MAVVKARAGEMDFRLTWIKRQDEWKKGHCWGGRYLIKLSSTIASPWEVLTQTTK